MAQRLSDQERLWRTVPESDVLRAVLDYAFRIGAYAWRNNTGAIKAQYKGRDRYIQFSEVGAADVFCIYRGQFIAIECKTETGRQSDEQKAWQMQIERAGGTYVLCRPSNWEQVISEALR
jgi:hypothetical protein